MTLVTVLADQGQVPGVDVGDAGTGALGHGLQQCGRDDLVGGADHGQDGMVFQAGVPDGSPSALRGGDDRGRRGRAGRWRSSRGPGPA